MTEVATSTDVTDLVAWPSDYDIDIVAGERINDAICGLCRDRIPNTEDERWDHDQIAHCGVCGDRIADHYGPDGLPHSDPCTSTPAAVTA